MRSVAHEEAEQRSGIQAVQISRLSSGKSFVGKRSLYSMRSLILSNIEI